MSSWLARSLTNSLRIDDNNDDDDDDDGESPTPAHRRRDHSPAPEIEYEGDRRGVNDDLTEFRETLTHQLLGVANFLAPPPPPPLPPDQRVVSEWDRSEMHDPLVSGEEEDEDDCSVYPHLEIGGIFQGINRRIVDNSDVLQNVDGDEDEDEDEDEDGDEVDDENEDRISEAVGLTDEVLTFAGNIAHHPETWLDFPVEDEEDLEDFPMSESQNKHAQAIEHFTPRLAALRIELCPAHMSLGFFWKVYFVLLHSRLNKQDAELLSTPEVAEARTKWMQELQKRSKKESERYDTGHYFRGSVDLDEDFTPRSDLTPRSHNEHSETLSSWTFASEPATSTTADSDTEKQVVSTDTQFAEKSINDEKPLHERDDRNAIVAQMYKRVPLNFDDDDDDDWPEDDCLGQNRTVIPVGMEEEISFSDLEDDDCCIPVKSKPEISV